MRISHILHAVTLWKVPNNTNVSILDHIAQHILQTFSKMSLQKRLRELKASYDERLIEKNEYDKTRADLLKNFASKPGK